MFIKKIQAFFKKYDLDFFNLALISLLSPLYFYKLGQSSLVSWDEAWYGAIARNILNSGNLIYLTYNGQIYSDHPPAGFWILALFESIFGANEFGVRVGSAIFGLIGLYLVYLIGRDLFSRAVGLASAFGLSSTYWYLYRARSGNLDIFLTVFFILTFYLGLKSSKNPKFLLPFFLSFGFLILTKALIPLTIIPALLIIFFGSKIKIKALFAPVITFLVITVPWFAAQYSYDPALFYKYFKTGAPGVGLKTDYMDNFRQIKEYLHNGVGKWFWPGVIGVILGPFTLNRGLIALSALCLTFFAPFILSDKGQLWHLIPLYPFIILAFFGFSWVLGKFLIKRFLKNYSKSLTILLTLGILLFGAYYSYIQIKRSWYEFIDISANITDEAILSKEASKYSYDFYIDGTDFTPAAYFYSGKKTQLVADTVLPEIFKAGKPFVLITYQWRLDKYKITPDQYQVIKTDRDKLLIIKK